MSSSHSRKIPARAALTRQQTRGPLDAEESLSATSSVHSSILATPEKQPSRTSSPLPTTTKNAIDNNRLLFSQSPKPSRPRTPLPDAEDAIYEDKDLSFLLDPSNFHPLSQLEVPTPFRRPFLAPPSSRTPMIQHLAELDNLLEQCDYLRAAQFTGLLLISGGLRSNDVNLVFHLLAVRYSCLELSGNITIAAQEAKALEDLNSTFYYVNLPPQPDAPVDNDPGRPPPPKHIMPFSLRMQAVRLQSIGFSDPRRGVSALYELGLECRDHLSHPSTPSKDRKIWSRHLEEVGIRVVNALIEMGDLECAARTMKHMRLSQSVNSSAWTYRMTLLLIKLGDIRQAQQLIIDSSLNEAQKTVVESLIEVAQGKYEVAAEMLSRASDDLDPDLINLAKQNLAVTYLYTGDIEKSRQLMEGLVDDKYSFQSLTINLATLYELTSDKARDHKLALVGKLAANLPTLRRPRPFLNSDFKLQT